MTERIPLDHLTSDQLDTLYDRLAVLEAGARERSALLEEARDALEAARINRAHGDDWPRLVPAIEQLVTERNTARAALRHRAPPDGLPPLPGDARTCCTARIGHHPTCQDNQKGA